jgi:3D (Asp-Asp-Asp) domain-containing protein
MFLVFTHHSIADPSFFNKKLNIRLTYYTLHECGGKNAKTASGKTPIVGHIAVSHDLKKAGWKFGKHVFIPGKGLYVIEDTMNKRWVRKMDIFHHSYPEARKKGCIKAVAYLLD